MAEKIKEIMTKDQEEQTARKARDKFLGAVDEAQILMGNSANAVLLGVAEALAGKADFSKFPVLLQNILSFAETAKEHREKHGLTLIPNDSPVTK